MAFSLPEGFNLYQSHDFQQDTKKAILLQLGSIAPFLLMAVLSLFIGLPSRFIAAVASIQEMFGLLLKLVIAALGVIICISLRELLLAALTKFTSGAFPEYKISWAGLSSRTDFYWSKGQYLATHLLPSAVASGILAILLFLVLAEWFWVFYFILSVQLGLTAGDLIFSLPILQAPAGSLIQDGGFRVDIYTKYGA